MSKRVDIAIAETSLIIRSGIVSVLSRINNLNSNIIEINDISILLEQLKESLPDILIINPSILGFMTPDKLRGKIGSTNTKIVALQSSITEIVMLNSYDTSISINDNSKEIEEKLTKLIAENKQESDTKKELTNREREVIVCIVKGMSNKQIAETLFLSPHTIIAHRRNISSKLQINSPAGLTIYAIVNKLVDISEVKDSIE